MYGLVLEGGGAKGAYHIGAYKAILELGINIKGIVGTSVGALNGALFVQGDIGKAEELWKNISYSNIIKNLDEDLARIKFKDLDRKNIKDIRKNLKDIISDGGLDISPLRELINNLIDEEKIRNSNMDFGLVATLVENRELIPKELYIEDIDKGKLADYLLASAYFPLFKTEELDGKVYLDGGLYNNLPIDLLINKGYENIIEIRTFGIGHIKKTDTKDINIIKIEPLEDLGGTLEFEAEKASYNINLGYFDGMKVFRNLKGSYYYLETDIGREYIEEIIWNLKEDKINLLKKLFGLKKEIDSKRALFEIIIPKISKLLDIKEDESYEKIFYSLLDNLGKIYAIERFKIYKLEEFISLIKKNIYEDFNKETRRSKRFLKNKELYYLLDRKEFIKEIGFILL